MTIKEWAIQISLCDNCGITLCEEHKKLRFKPTYFDDMRGMYPRLKAAFDRAQLELLRRYASR